MLEDKKTSKFKRLYGMTLQQMSDKYGFTVIYLWRLHQRDELRQFIEEREEIPCK